MECISLVVLWSEAYFLTSKSFEGGGSEAFELPPIELATLPQIAKVCFKQFSCNN